MKYNKTLEEIKLEIQKILDDNHCCITSEYDEDLEECNEYLIRRDINSTEQVYIGV